MGDGDLYASALSPSHSRHVLCGHHVGCLLVWSRLVGETAADLELPAVKAQAAVEEEIERLAAGDPLPPLHSDRLSSFAQPSYSVSSSSLLSRPPRTGIVLRGQLRRPPTWIARLERGEPGHL